METAIPLLEAEGNQTPPTWREEDAYLGRTIIALSVGGEANVPETPGTGLSEKQLEVLHCAFEGLCPEEIAEKLYLNEKTIRDRLSKAYAKLGARNLSHAIRLLIILGILEIKTETDSNISLTETEQRHLDIASLGFSRMETARKMRISYHTVKHHRSKILAKLGVRSMVLAVRRGFELGLLPLPEYLVDVPD